LFSTVLGVPNAKVRICHFPGHVQPNNPDQPDFILDTGLSQEEREAECTDRDGTILRVSENAISPVSDSSRHGHKVDG